MLGDAARHQGMTGEPTSIAAKLPVPDWLTGDHLRTFRNGIANGYREQLTLWKAPSGHGASPAVDRAGLATVCELLRVSARRRQSTLAANGSRATTVIAVGDTLADLAVEAGAFTIETNLSALSIRAGLSRRTVKSRLAELAPYVTCSVPDRTECALS